MCTSAPYAKPNLGPTDIHSSQAWPPPSLWPTCPDAASGHQASIVTRPSHPVPLSTDTSECLVRPLMTARMWWPSWVGPPWSEYLLDPSSSGALVIFLSLYSSRSSSVVWPLALSLP